MPSAEKAALSDPYHGVLWVYSGLGGKVNRESDDTFCLWHIARQCPHSPDPNHSSLGSYSHNPPSGEC